MTEGYASLSEKEKETLRLIVRGHDAKSAARQLDLSIHTVNERLRDARRKLSVSSSREAARIVLAAEGRHPPIRRGQAFRGCRTRPRLPLGAVVSREVYSQEALPAPPHGYVLIKFLTRLAKRPAGIETVSLEREGANWKVVGYWIA